jgi:signal transduction histidine kinase
VLIIILFLSSSISYTYFSGLLERRFRDTKEPTAIIVTLPNGNSIVREANTTSQNTSANQRGLLPRAQDVQDDLINSLFVVNGGLVLLAVILSYFLARLTLEPIKEAYEKQRRFLSDASHELRTPLTILHAELENELDLSQSQEVREKIQSNLEEVERMSTMVNDLLTLSRMDESEHASMLTVHEVHLSEFLNKITHRMRDIADKHAVTLGVEIPHDITLTVNENLLQHTVINIVKNAILYNKKDGEVTITACEVEAKDSSDKARVEIQIADTGVGIDNNDLEKIFDRFYRADTSRSRKTGGSGLGLAIVKSSMDKMGGTIRMESEPGKGTTVTLIFPRV